MKRSDFKTVDEYIGTFPEDVQENLQKIRQIIKNAVPQAEEVISYQIPTFKLHGNFAYYAAFANHYSLFIPSTLGVHEKFEKELKPYVQAKGTIQFQKSEPIPFDLIEKMVKYAAKTASR